MTAPDWRSRVLSREENRARGRAAYLGALRYLAPKWSVGVVVPVLVVVAGWVVRGPGFAVKVAAGMLGLLVVCGGLAWSIGLAQAARRAERQLGPERRLSVQWLDAGFTVPSATEPDGAGFDEVVWTRTGGRDGWFVLVLTRRHHVGLEQHLLALPRDLVPEAVLRGWGVEGAA